MDETGYRMKEYDILAFCLCLIKCSEPFQLSSRVKEMDLQAESPRFSSRNWQILSQNSPRCYPDTTHVFRLFEKRFERITEISIGFVLYHGPIKLQIVYQLVDAVKRIIAHWVAVLWHRQIVLLSLSDWLYTISSSQLYHDAVNTLTGLNLYG